MIRNKIIFNEGMMKLFRTNQSHVKMELKHYMELLSFKFRLHQFYYVCCVGGVAKIRDI